MLQYQTLPYHTITIPCSLPPSAEEWPQVTIQILRAFSMAILHYSTRSLIKSNTNPLKLQHSRASALNALYVCMCIISSIVLFKIVFRICIYSLYVPMVLLLHYTDSIKDQASTVSCIECSDEYCVICFASQHRRGARASHKPVPIEKVMMMLLLDYLILNYHIASFCFNMLTIIFCMPSIFYNEI